MKIRMRKEYRHIALWLSSMLMLLCTACGGSESESDDNNPSKEHQLQINIFTPEHPVVTRADDQVLVNSNADENVNTMDLWVFVGEVTNTTIPVEQLKFPVGKVVGHLSLDIADPSSFVGGTYQMSVSEDFANELPKVNVYVTANVKSSNTGITLTAGSPESDFGTATLSGRYFGLDPLTTEPPTEGLPMSGLLKNQTINDDRTPLLKVEDPVKVVRAVSKVRFIFSRTDTGDTDKLQINSISLANGMIPEVEYLFLSDSYDAPSKPRYHIGSDFLGAETLASDLGSITIPTSTYPARYAYDSENANQVKGQYYENEIDKGLKGHYSEGTYIVGDPELVELGRYYFRESNKQLQGTISYTIGTGEPKTATFRMYEGDNFTRNHTWIVYGYFTGKETLKVSCVNVTDWDQSTTSHPVYNW